MPSERERASVQQGDDEDNWQEYPRTTMSYVHIFPL